MPAQPTYGASLWPQRQVPTREEVKKADVRHERRPCPPETRGPGLILPSGFCHPPKVERGLFPVCVPPKSPPGPSPSWRLGTVLHIPPELCWAATAASSPALLPWPGAGPSGSLCFSILCISFCTSLPSRPPKAWPWGLTRAGAPTPPRHPAICHPLPSPPPLLSGGSHLLPLPDQFPPSSGPFHTAPPPPPTPAMISGVQCRPGWFLFQNPQQWFSQGLERPWAPPTTAGPKGAPLSRWIPVTWIAKRAWISKKNEVIVIFKEFIKSSGLPWWLSGQESACKAGDLVRFSGPGRSPEEGNGNPLQYSCLGNPMDRGDWWATVREAQKLDTT